MYLFIYLFIFSFLFIHSSVYICVYLGGEVQFPNFCNFVIHVIRAGERRTELVSVLLVPKAIALTTTKLLKKFNWSF